MIGNVRVRYGIIDQTIEGDTRTDSVSSESDYSDTANLDEPNGKSRLVSLEADYTLLDGSHVFAEPGLDVGWESESVSGSSGELTQWVRFEFGLAHVSYGMLIRFQADSLADSFTITYYNGATVLATTAVTDNKLTIYRDNSTVLGWDTIKIEVTKTQHPNQRARIESLVFGVTETYTEDDIISLTASRTISLTADVVESSEMSMKLFNSGQFDIQTIKDIPIEIQKGTTLEVQTKQKKESNFTEWGTYYSAGISVENEGRIIRFTAYDALYALGETWFQRGTIPSAPKSLADWAQEVAVDARVQVYTDPTLETMMSDGYIGYVPHREALRLIAEAGNCVLWYEVDEELGGFVLIVPRDTWPGFIPFGEVQKDEILKDTLIVSNDELISGVAVERNTFTRSPTKSGLAEIQDIALTGAEQSIWVDYAAYPADVVVGDIVSSSNITIDAVKSQCYSEGALVVFTGTASEIGWITILGYVYATSTTPHSGGSESGLVREVKNTLITRSEMAEAVLTHLLARTENVYKYRAELKTMEYSLYRGIGREIEIEGRSIVLSKHTIIADRNQIISPVEGYDA